MSYGSKSRSEDASSGTEIIVVAMRLAEIVDSPAIDFLIGLLHESISRKDCQIDCND